MATSVLVFSFLNIIFASNAVVLNVTEFQKREKHERIVTDLEVIYGCRGVEIAEWYSETSDSNLDSLVSAPGCPKSIDGYPWLHYGNPPRCYLAAHSGPCSSGEKLLIQRWSSYGACGCECLFDDDFSKQLQGRDRYVRCWKRAESVPPPNEQIYDKKSRSCYYMYEQGPCPPGRVIVDFTSTSLKCLPLCDETQSNWMSIQEQGLCDTPKYILSSSPVNSSSNKCDIDEIYSTALVKCVKQNPGRKFVIG